MKIIAIFKGKNGSLGYKTGQAYTLFLTGSSIRRVSGGGLCVYSSIESFLENWICFGKI